MRFLSSFICFYSILTKFSVAAVDGKCNPVSVLNDDFCDCLDDGADETSSSACAANSGKFQCVASSVAKTVIIPSSRYHDGVCDCCDGSDEKGSPFFASSAGKDGSTSKNGGCPNTCGNDLVAAKQAALNWHRELTAGLRARREIIDELRRKKASEGKSLDNLKKEKQALENSLLDMLLLLKAEEKSESKRRLNLLRDRQNRCASGDDEACDLFFSGFFPLDSEASRGFPMENAPERMRNQVKNPPPTPTGLVGMERLRAARCELGSSVPVKGAAVNNDKNTVAVEDCPVAIFPDESARLFITAGEYLSFTNSKAGRTQMLETVGHGVGISPRNVYQMRKETTLFGFLEADDEEQQGLRLVMQFALQLLGLSASPVILVLQQLVRSVYWVGEVAYNVVDTCAASAETAGYDSVDKLCKIVTDAYVEGTPTQQFLDALDPYQYSRVTHFLEWIQKPGYFPKYATLAWGFDVIWNAPQFYIDYYFYGKYTQLPPTRHACMLRTAIKVARSEIQSMTQRINERSPKNATSTTSSSSSSTSSSSSSGAAEDTSASGGEVEVDSKVKARRNAAKKSAATAAAASSANKNIDYGLSGEWEAVRDICLETDKEIGGYKYSFCFFGDFKQGSTLIGKYSQWGAIDVEKARAQPVSKKGQSTTTEDAAARKKDRDSDSDMQRYTNADYYSKMVYDRGAICQAWSGKGQKPKRAAQVDLQCGINNAIIDIVETEMCLYHITVRTPLACKDAMEQDSLEALDRLGVFGFSSVNSHPPTSPPPKNIIAQSEKEEEGDKGGAGDVDEDVIREQEVGAVSGGY